MVLARVLGDGLDLKVLFRTEDATLSPADEARLDVIAKLLKAAPGWSVAVEGHTDLRGADDYNQALSEARAGSVRDALVSLGIASERIALIGTGAADSASAHDDPDGMALERRADIRIRQVPERVAGP